MNKAEQIQEQAEQSRTVESDVNLRDKAARDTRSMGVGDLRPAEIHHF